MEDFRVAIVIPAYNEAKTIASVINSVKDLASVIVVNDNSNDETARVAEELGVTVVDLKKNRGYEGAIDAGFEKAEKDGFDFVLTMDADGQHTREAVLTLINKAKSNKHGLTLGFRQQHARISEYFFCKYFKLRFGIEDALCGLKLYPIQLYRKYGCFDSKKLVGTELLLFGLKSKISFEQIPIFVKNRDGDSRYGSIIKANCKIFNALWHIMKMDVKDN